MLERWHPVTSDFGLIEAPAADAADCWQRMMAAEQTRLKRRLINGDLAQAIDALAPLSAEMRRTVFIASDMGWTLFMRNGFGSDPFMPMWSLCKTMEVRTMRVCATPPGATWPAVIWEVYAPPALGGDDNYYLRSIQAANDGGRWVFSESGERFAFETPERYASKRKRDRFDRALLEDYLRAFGLDPFDHHRYRVDEDSPAILLEEPKRLVDFFRVPAFREFSFAEAQAGVPWHR